MIAGVALVASFSLLAYLQTASGRRLLAAKVSELVSRELVAELRIERIDVLSRERLAISDLTLFDAKGRAVLGLRGLSVPLSPWTMLRSALEPTARVELPRVHVEQLQLGLYRTESGGISLVDALESASPATSKTPPKASNGPRIHLPSIVIDRASARTDFGDLSRATTEFQALNVNFDSSPQSFSLGLTTADARVSGALPLEAKGRLRAELRFPGATEASFDGALGALPIHASFRLNGDDLALSSNSESIAPEAMRALIPSWPLVAPVSVRAEASGRLTAMDVRVDARAGASQLNCTGSVALSPSLKGDLSLTGSELDARLFAPSAPQTALGIDAKLELAFDSELHVALNARSAKSDVSGVALPETNIVAAYAGNQLTGTLTSLDRALPVSIDLRVTPAGVSSFHARGQDLDLAALAPYGLHARGHADFDGSGELRDSRIAAQFEARIRAFQSAPLLAESTTVRAKLRGPVALPDQLGLELEVQGTKLSTGMTEFPSWAIDSRGSLERQSVSLRAGPQLAPTLQASTTLALGPGVSLSDTRLQAELNGVRHAVSLKFARFAGQVLELSGLHWQVGSGTFEGSALLSPTRKLVELEASGVRPEELSKTLGIDVGAFQGQLGLSLRFEESGRARRARLSASLLNGVVTAIGAVQADALVNVTDSEVDAEATLISPQLGRGKLSARGSLGHAPLGWDVATRAVGEIELDVRDVDLTEVSRRWLQTAGVAASGFVDGSVRLAKLDASAPAVIGYQLKTRDFGLRSQLSGADGKLLHGQISSQGEIGANQTSLQVELMDAAGPWISAKVEHGAGLVELVRAVRTASPAHILSSPLHAVVGARPRSLELFGGAVSRAFRGEVAADVEITGTVLRPEIEGSLSGTRLAGVGPDATGQLQLNFDYSAAREEYAISARYVDRTRAKLELSAGGRFGWKTSGHAPDWSARAEAKIEKLELGPLGELVAIPLAGAVGGQVTVSASPDAFEAEGQLDLDRLTLDRHALGSGQAQLRVHRGLAEAELKLAGADSSLEVSGEVGLCWAGGPCVDAARGGSVDVKVRNYQLSTLAPLLRSAASDVRGPLNGFVTLAWDPADQTGKRKTHLRADLVVDGGSVILSAGAGSFQCVKLRAHGDGSSRLMVDVSGCARSKRPNFWANAELAWNGLLPERVAVELYTEDPTGEKTPQGRGGKVPVTFDGVLLGSATVRKTKPIRVTIALAPTERSIEANIPALEFELPAKDDTSLVDLTEDPAIVITDAKAPPVPATEASEGTPMKISVHLGNGVTLTQPGITSALRVPVTGSLTQEPNGLLDGKIVLPEGGTVPQLGQIFRLKRGSVRFSHQALKDGALSLEASTRTADGVVVELYVSGTVEKPVIRLRSDPPRSENDIIALLLGVQGSDTASTSGQQGAELRGSATALAMNQLLRGSALAGFQFGAGQTHRGDSVSTVSVRASSTVWFEGRTVRSSTQRAANSAVQSSGVIDWRFARGFSLRTQLGNISGLELRWSHRY